MPRRAPSSHTYISAAVSLISRDILLLLLLLLRCRLLPLAVGAGSGVDVGWKMIKLTYCFAAALHPITSHHIPSTAIHWSD